MLVLKLAGASLLLAATSTLGFQIAARYASRPRELRELQTALSVLMTEVDYGATPLPGALRSAAGAAGPATGSLLVATAERLAAGGGTTPGEALRAALAAEGDRTALTPADREILAALASVLGASGRADQVRHLRLALDRLAGAEAAATDERARYERLYRYAGILAGLALILILI